MTMTIDNQLLNVPQVFYNFLHHLARLFVVAAILRTRFADILSKATADQITIGRSYGCSLKVLLEKKQRKKDRAAARLALEQMKKTVYIYEDEETLKEVERLRNVQFFCPKPLELLGLYLKNDYMEEEEEEEEEEEDM